MNRENFDRLIFVLQTKYKVALLNYSTEQTFHPALITELLRNRRLIMGVVSTVIFLLVTITISNSRFFAGKPVATIPEVVKVNLKPVEFSQAVVAPHAVVEKGVITRKAIEPIYKYKIPEKTEKELSKLVATIPQPTKGKQYAVAVDKSSRTLYILLENKKNYAVVQTFRVSLGQIMGDKLREGDKKTPEGFYKVIQVKEDDELPGIYGPRAFVLNYPNKYDRANGSTGGGIWIHGTGNGLRTPDTKGCVEVTDENIMALGKWIGVETPVLIFPARKPLIVKNGTVKKDIITKQFFYAESLASLKPSSAM